MQQALQEYLVATVTSREPKAIRPRIRALFAPAFNIHHLDNAKNWFEYSHEHQNHIKMNYRKCWLIHFTTIGFYSKQ